MGFYIFTNDPFFLNEIFGGAMQMVLHLKPNNCMVATKSYGFENNCLFSFKKEKRND
jgi:hypothetical protein